MMCHCDTVRVRSGTADTSISGWGCAAGTLEPLTYTLSLIHI